MIAKKDIHCFADRRRILLQTSDFICLSPHPGLQAYIANYNVTFPTKYIMPDGFTIMPSGCSTLTIGSNRRRLFIDLDGPTTKPYIADSQAAPPEMMVTIEFKPAGLYALTGINQSELTDKTISFEAVDPQLAKALSEVIEKAEHVDALVTSLDLLLLKNMQGIYHPQLRIAYQSIIDCAGDISVKKLSDDMHYSERQLNRIFKQNVGISAKSFSRLIRINNAFHLLKKPHNSLTLVSDLTGFHDLSHFVRDFKLVCGMTPQAFRHNMSDFYINPTKF
ncbi:MAG: helix-turn-helix transcriptional regulator [Defluviitaleaceae bacterium]|nr:helix-turn-helix transcriptional regulator [Defluviitaleaceae bacterium]